VGSQHAIGVDLGGTKILAGVLDRGGELLQRYERATPTRSQPELLAALDEVVEAVWTDDIAAVGFGIPSTLDRGRAVGSVNIPLADVDLGARMRERFDVAAGVDNDANAATIAEWQLGAGRGTTEMVMLTLGTGCGGGLILGGRPYRGAVGAAAELGHMVLVHDGRPCQGACTGRGHLEAYVTGLAATAAAREAFGPAADSHRLVRLANEGDETATGVLAEIGGYLGSAFGSLVNIFDPEVIVVGGGFGTAAGEHLLAPARRVLAREALPPGRDQVRIARAELGTAAGVIGAGLVAFEALDAAYA
jgi:glucokinase